MELLYIFFLIHCIYAITVTRKIFKSVVFSRRIKWLNTILTWLLPFFWGAIVSYIIKPPKYEVITKQNRKVKPDGNNTDNWQSLTGYGEGGNVNL